MGNAIPRQALPARQALIDTLAAVSVKQAALDDLRQSLERLNGIVGAETDAKNAVNAVLADDAAALARWVDGGATGNPPAPSTDARNAAAKALSIAKAKADPARQAHVDLQPKLEDTIRELDGLQRQLPNLRTQVLLEELRPFAEGFRAMALRARLVEQVLAVTSRMIWDSQPAAAEALRDATRSHGAENQQIESAIQTHVRQLIGGFQVALASDPHARLPELTWPLTPAIAA